MESTDVTPPAFQQFLGTFGGGASKGLLRKAVKHCGAGAASACSRARRACARVAHAAGMVLERHLQRWALRASCPAPRGLGELVCVAFLAYRGRVHVMIATSHGAFSAGLGR